MFNRPESSNIIVSGFVKYNKPIGRFVCRSRVMYCNYAEAIPVLGQH